MIDFPRGFILYIDSVYCMRTISRLDFILHIATSVRREKMIVKDSKKTLFILDLLQRVELFSEPFVVRKRKKERSSKQIIFRISSHSINWLSVNIFLLFEVNDIIDKTVGLYLLSSLCSAAPIFKYLKRNKNQVVPLEKSYRFIDKKWIDNGWKHRIGRDSERQRMREEKKTQRKKCNVQIDTQNRQE